MTAKKMLWVAGVLIAITVLVTGGKLFAQNFQVQPAPPPGVAAANWISISGNSGFVVQKEARTPDAVTGYFMVKRGATWWRGHQRTGGASGRARRLNTPGLRFAECERPGGAELSEPRRVR